VDGGAVRSRIEIGKRRTEMATATLESRRSTVPVLQVRMLIEASAPHRRIEEVSKWR
jgi:hypothetical protein